MTVASTAVVQLLAGGPGYPELWTVRAEEVLAASRIVVCDRELAGTVRRLAPHARLVAVDGADDGAASLVEHAGSAGLVRVARGDRLVWEAGGVEAAALRQAGVAYEVVPAVVAAFAAPALDGIPVMARPDAATLTVAVGRPAPEVSGGTVVSLDDEGSVSPTVTGAVTARQADRAGTPHPGAIRYG